MVLRGFHVYKHFLGWVVGRFNIAVNREHNCGVHTLWDDLRELLHYLPLQPPCPLTIDLLTLSPPWTESVKAQLKAKLS